MSLAPLPVTIVAINGSNGHYRQEQLYPAPLLLGVKKVGEFSLDDRNEMHMGVHRRQARYVHDKFLREKCMMTQMDLNIHCPLAGNQSQMGQVEGRRKGEWVLGEGTCLFITHKNCSHQQPPPPLAPTTHPGHP